MNKDERKEKFEEYGHGYDLFTAGLAEIPHRAWELKPALNVWSVHEIVVHMADSEAMGALRVRKLIAEPGSTLMPYEDAKWADALNYQNQNTDDASQIFKLVRQTTYRLLKTSPDRVFTQSVTHPEYPEPYTLEKWLNIYVRPISEHSKQLKKTFQAWKEQNQ